MRVCLFEDQAVLDLEPLSLTRPVFDLLCGLDSLAAKQRRAFGEGEAGALVRPYLAGLLRARQPRLPVNDLAWLRAGVTVLVNGRWLPPSTPPADAPGPCVAMVGDEVAYAVVPPDRLAACAPNTVDDCLEMWKGTLPLRPAGGRLVRYLWDLVQANAEQIGRDYEAHSNLPAHRLPPGLAVVGPTDLLAIDPSARFDPMVFADTTRGPVVVDRGAFVASFSRLEGPCYVGPGTQVLGAKIRGGTTLGPGCRIGGEVEASIVHANSNKYHDGFLGHSYIGEWVNLGAGTQNSDLRNDYDEVLVTANGRSVATGLTKVGCLLGDHTKTGLGTLLNTGSTVGVFCNLLPSGRLLSKYIPSFSSWWDGALAENMSLPHLFRTAGHVLGRRGQEFTEEHVALFRLLFDLTAAERRRALQTGDRRLRRSA
jgi:UDP-N-acetylglucosamine diphosphorylase / glucose-1-phosphate thymidylyltransferase / UDP-N-acetylgalactosamine diphosphorylase / glucosamine-1-phosphate N-acetyltransferase / galactosamine-1-phosphate N-acetyltransferase